MNEDEFRRHLRQQGEELYRDMPWRQDTRPYYVLVSELMLQQTQVDRVIPKFNAFIERFPDEWTLSDASLADVLVLWQGLGYNRRAKFLHEASKAVVAGGSFPNDATGLMALPGVGKNTAGAILAYAYNQPAIYVETNVRAVYIHHFFNDIDAVDDKAIHEMIEQTIDKQHPREFYWALMDYGSWLKKQGVRPNQSRHYKKQSPLKGSVREVRGQIIKQLTDGDTKILDLQAIFTGDKRFDSAINGLIKDGLIVATNDYYHLAR